MTTVLVVDDEPQILRALAINLRARHYEVFTALTGAAALATAAALLGAVAFVDWLTGPRLDLSLFYSVPVCFVTWYAGSS